VKRILLAKIGIDAHDRGVRVVAHGLRDAGMEVIYTGPWQTVEDVVSTAVQEDVDVIGISALGGDYILIPKLFELLKNYDVNIPVVIGGIIPSDVEEELRQLGIADVFHPGASIDDIVGRIQALLSQNQSVS
jgi:methylmalonyl-CoA mutase C-terminal domain/subunit